VGALVFAPLRLAFGDAPTWADEVFYAEPARELAIHGVLRSPILGEVRGVSEVFALQPPVAVVERALVYRLFGFGKRQTRIAGALEYGLCLAVLFLSVFRASGTSSLRVLCAAVASLLFAMNSKVMRAAIGGRPDMVAVALMLCALLCAVEASRRERAGAWVFAVGAFSALSASSHPVMLSVCPGAALACTLYVPAKSRGRAFVLFCFGWLLGALPWLLHIALHPDAWRMQFIDHFRAAFAGGSAELNAEPSPLENILHNMRSSGVTPHVTVAMLVGLLLCARYAKGPARVPMLFASFSLIALIPGENFAKFVVAFLYAAGCLGFCCALSAWNLSSRSGVWVMVLLLLVAPIVRHVHLVASKLDAELKQAEQPIERLIAQHVPSGALVVSTPVSYFALRKRGAEPLFGRSLQALRYARTQDDRAAHEAYVLRRRPSFLLLKRRTKPGSIAGLGQHATFTLLGSARSLPGTPRTVRDRYDLRLYRVNYSPI
jgi:4-amino-4-deoxy-L-arabinose transferase-like glycosyltransferase